MQHYQRIRDLREDSDLTQKELCEKLYMHKTTYTNYEQGKHTVPLDFAVLLADFYGVSLDYIAGRTNHPHGAGESLLPEDEKLLLRKYAVLTERSKGKLELFLDQLCDQQEQQLHSLKEAR
ncbi:MAG: helix-turn-helix transcriptional regulator [Ruminococcus sp.]|nr:helix-turn-helix transcriptional regulator [Ruminococcus sp.]